MFVGKAWDLPYSGASESCFTRVGSGLIHRHWTKLERLARDKHLAYYENLQLATVKSVIGLVPKLVGLYYKTFYRPNL